MGGWPGSASGARDWAQDGSLVLASGLTTVGHLARNSAAGGRPNKVLGGGWVGGQRWSQCWLGFVGARWQERTVATLLETTSFPRV